MPERDRSGGAVSSRQSRERMRLLGIPAKRGVVGEPPSLVSVVIPAYNVAERLGEQLLALASQDYRGHWEIVVADNGSTDGTRQVAEGFRARLPNLRTVDASSVKGAAHARNVGTAASDGDVIAYTDADDVVEGDWLRKLVDALADHDFVAGRMDQRTLDAVDHEQAEIARYEWNELPTTLDFLPWGFGGNLAIRRSAFTEADGWDETYPAVNDVPFCWRVQLRGYPLAFVPDAVVHYRARASLRGLARQHHAFGRQHVRLYRDFRRFGAQRSSPTRAARRWAKVVVSLPDLFRSADHRRAWVRVAMMSLGRARGSLELRTFCP